MKLFFFSTYFLPYLSGAIMYPYKLLTYRAQKGDAVIVYTFLYDKMLLPKEKLDGLRIDRVSYWIRLSKGFLSPLLPFQIVANLSKSDVVILNQPTFEGVLVAFTAILFGKKIISLFNCEVDLGDGFKNRLISLFLNISVLMQLFLSFRIVAYTEDYAKHTLLRFFRRKLTFILPPIEKYAVSQKKYAKMQSVKKNSQWIGFCGRISKEKGIENLIDAYGYLVGNADLRSLPITLVFAGPYGKDVIGENGYFQKIERQLKKENIPHLFLGKLSGGELGAFYKAIDCLVLPSINKTEAFGIVQTEAMVMGTPVVASNLPGVRVPVQLTGMGKIAKIGDGADIAAKIQEVLKDKYIATEQKRKRAEELFSKDKFYENWDKLLTCI